MKLGVLFSGGKDSCLAMKKAMEQDEVVCLISVYSRNPESYMFHTPNIDLTKNQSKAIGIPLVIQESLGVKEDELHDLELAIIEAKNKHGIEGVVTGAIGSVYQTSRVQRICDKLGLWCFNPLWLKDQVELMRELLSEKFKVMISGVFGFPLDEKWLGKIIDEKTLEELIKLNQKYQISPSGEGGEIETTVLDAPFFKITINPLNGDIIWDGNSGIFQINKFEMMEK